MPDVGTGQRTRLTQSLLQIFFKMYLFLQNSNAFPVFPNSTVEHSRFLITLAVVTCCDMNTRCIPAQWARRAGPLRTDRLEYGDWPAEARASPSPSVTSDLSCPACPCGRLLQPALLLACDWLTVSLKQELRGWGEWGAQVHSRERPTVAENMALAPQRSAWCLLLGCIVRVKLPSAK